MWSLGVAGDHHHAFRKIFVKVFLHGGRDLLLDLELLEGLCRDINCILLFDSRSQILIFGGHDKLESCRWPEKDWIASRNGANG